MTGSTGRNAVRIGLLAGLVALAAGCTTIRDHRGYIMDSALIDSVQPGIDNRQSVEGTLGRPTFISQFGDKSWFYVSQEARQKPFKRAWSHEQ